MKKVFGDSLFDPMDIVAVTVDPPIVVLRGPTYLTVSPIAAKAIVEHYLDTLPKEDVDDSVEKEVDSQANTTADLGNTATRAS